MKNTFLAIGILVVLLLVGYFVFLKEPKPIPVVNKDPNLKTYIDPSGAYSFDYPESLGTNYVNLFDWPPKIQITDDQFSCVEAGLENGRAGETKLVTINEHKYCQTKIVEGAAGSMYTEYAYAAQVKNKTLYYTFTIRQPQCGNYDEPKRNECQNEEDSFNILPIIDKIIQSTAVSL